MNSMADKILQFYLLIMAIPLAKMIEVVSKNPEYNSIIRFSILLVVVIEWVYSQTSFTSKYEYLPQNNLTKNIATIFSEIGVCVSVAIAAYKIENEISFYTFMVAFFIFDLITQFLTKPSKRSHPMRKVTIIWVSLDILESFLFSSIILFANYNLMSESIRASSIFIVVTLIALFDFIKNRDFYFDEAV